MNDHDLAIPTRYDIFLQDLTTPYINLTFLGYVKTIDEAKAMCKAFREGDKEDCDRGLHTYLFRCSRLSGERSGE